MAESTLAQQSRNRGAGPTLFSSPSCSSLCARIPQRPSRTVSAGRWSSKKKRKKKNTAGEGKVGTDATEPNCRWKPQPQRTRARRKRSNPEKNPANVGEFSVDAERRRVATRFNRYNGRICWQYAEGGGRGGRGTGGGGRGGGRGGGEI